MSAFCGQTKNKGKLTIIDDEQSPLPDVECQKTNIFAQA